MISALIALAVFGMVVGIASTGYQNQKQSEFQEDAQAFSAEQQEDAQQFNAAQSEEAYNRQVEFYENYMSPKAKMQQFREAGLNEALMYGGAGSGSSSPLPAASSTPVGAGLSSASPLNALGPITELMNTLSMVKVNESIANKNNAEADESGARKLNYQELAGLTAQQRLTEIEKTSEVAAQAANLTQKTKIDMERWNKESLKLGEEITEIQKRQGVLDAEKDKLIADKLAQEANASYRRWYADTASLRYWVDTGFKVLATGIDIARVASVWKIVKGKLGRTLPNVTDGGNVDDQGYGGYHRSDSDDFIDYMDEVIQEMDQLPPPSLPFPAIE